MRIGMVIELARESECRPFISKVTSMTKHKRSCSQASALINRVVGYFARLKYVKALYQAWQYTVRCFKSSISSCSQSTAQIKNCYYTDWRVWLKRLSVDEASREVYKWTGANYDCRSARMWRTQKGMSFTIYGVFCLTVFLDAALQVLSMWNAFLHWTDWCKSRDYCMQFRKVNHVFY